MDKDVPKTKAEHDALCEMRKVKAPALGMYDTVYLMQLLHSIPSQTLEELLPKAKAREMAPKHRLIPAMAWHGKTGNSDATCRCTVQFAGSAAVWECSLTAPHPGMHLHDEEGPAGLQIYWKDYD